MKNPKKIARTEAPNESLHILACPSGAIRRRSQICQIQCCFYIRCLVNPSRKHCLSDIGVCIKTLDKPIRLFVKGTASKSNLMYLTCHRNNYIPSSHPFIKLAKIHSVINLSAIHPSLQPSIPSNIHLSAIESLYQQKTCKHLFLQPICYYP